VVEALFPVLEEVLVLEVSTDLGAAYGGRILSDMGAKVIKVAPLDDDERVCPAGDQSSFHLSGLEGADCGKEWIWIDSRSARGQEVIGRLLATAAVIITDDAVPPYADPHSASRVPHHQLIVEVIPDKSGSPDAAFLRTGESQVDLAPKESDDFPVMPRVNVGAVDGGATIGLAVLSWLWWSLQPGQAVRRVHARVAARDAGVSLLRQDLATIRLRESGPPPFLTLRVKCLDGYVVAHVSYHSIDKWKALVGGEAGTLSEEFDRWAASKTREEAERAGQEQDLPVGSVLTVAEVLRDPQLLSRGYVTEDRSNTTAFLPFLETQSLRRWTAAPIVPPGEEGKSIWSGLGFSADDLTALHRGGAIR
jgi:CoA-transferase family III